MVVEVKPIAGPFTLGEGPHWDEKSKSLYFVDIDGKLLCKYNPANNTVTKCSLGKLSFLAPILFQFNLRISGNTHTKIHISTIKILRLPSLKSTFI